MINISEYQFPENLYPIEFESINSNKIRQWAILAFEESYELTNLINVQDDRAIQRSSLSSILLYLGLRIVSKFQLNKEETTLFINNIRSELAPAIIIDLQLEILDDYSSVEEFVKEKLIDFKDEDLILSQDSQDFESENSNSEFRNLSFMVLAEPLKRFDFEKSYEDLEYFDEYMLDKYDDFAEICNKAFRSKTEPQIIQQSLDYLEKYLKKYKEEYGEIKFNEIKKKIYTNNLVMQNLALLINDNPHKSQIVPMILSIPYFILAKRTTVALGCILFIEYWQISFNNQFQILKDPDLHNLFTRTLNKALKLL